MLRQYSWIACLWVSCVWVQPGRADEPADVLSGVREFYRRTAQPDGSFAPGIDPDYRGMSDSAYSDLAPVTYACTIHKTFGWTLPHEEKTIEFLLSRQREDGSFFNVDGTVEPDSAEGRCYNTTQGLVALHALGSKPRCNPLGVFEDILKQDFQKLPAYSTSFFPLAYLCYGQPIPTRADRAIRVTMVQVEDGYLHDHIAATFHASHYYRLIGEPTPMAAKIVTRMLRDQKPDGSWLLNMPSRDRHAAFDAVFTMRQEGGDRDDCRQAIAKAARWALSCRNADGGFGHFPGSPSDADANYFHLGTLVMAGFLKPVDPLPPDAHLLSWGHLIPPREKQNARDADVEQQKSASKLPGWIGGVAFNTDGKRLAAACADKNARLFDAAGSEQLTLAGHDDVVVAVAFAPDGKTLATGSFDRSARLWEVATGRALHQLVGHDGAVMCVAFSPNGKTLASGSIDGTVRLWDTATGKARATLKGHNSWVNAVAFNPDGEKIVSASSDGTLRLWNAANGQEQVIVDADPAEVRSVAWSADGSKLAAGIRYGRIKIWNVGSWQPHLDIKAHQGDVWSVVFSSDGRWLFTGDGDWDGPGQIKMWDTATGREQAIMESPGEILGLAISKDGKTLAFGGRDGRLIVRESPSSGVARGPLPAETP